MITSITRATLVIISKCVECVDTDTLHCSNESNYYRQANSQGCSISSLMANNETLLETASSLNSLGHSPKAHEIFHCDTKQPLPGLKRKFEGGEEKVGTTTRSVVAVFDAVIFDLMGADEKV